MIKFFLLFLCMVLTAASNVKNGTEVGQFELGRPNVNGTEGGLRRLMKNFQENGVRSSRRNLAASCSYKQYDGKDRYGGDISCGRYSSHQSIKEACNSKSNCIGYTLWKGNPWCLKTTSSDPIGGRSAHVYYERYREFETKIGICENHDLDWSLEDKPEGINDWNVHVGLGWRTCHELDIKGCENLCKNMEGCTHYSFNPNWCCFPFKSTQQTCETSRLNTENILRLYKHYSMC